MSNCYFKYFFKLLLNIFCQSYSFNHFSSGLWKLRIAEIAVVVFFYLSLMLCHTEVQTGLRSLKTKFTLCVCHCGTLLTKGKNVKFISIILGLETFSQLVYEDEYGTVSERWFFFFFIIFIDNEEVLLDEWSWFNCIFSEKHQFNNNQWFPQICT